MTGANIMVMKSTGNKCWGSEKSEESSHRNGSR